jgi:hypothetical protein
MSDGSMQSVIGSLSLDLHSLLSSKKSIEKECLDSAIALLRSVQETSEIE